MNGKASRFLPLLFAILLAASCTPKKVETPPPMAPETSIGRTGFVFSPPADWQALPQELLDRIPSNGLKAIGGSAEPIPVAAFSSNAEGMCLVSVFGNGSGSGRRELEEYLNAVRLHFSANATLDETRFSGEGFTAVCLRIVDEETVVYKLIAARGVLAVFQIDYIVARDCYTGDVPQKLQASLSSVTWGPRR